MLDKWFCHHCGKVSVVPLVRIIHSPNVLVIFKADSETATTVLFITDTSALDSVLLILVY